MQEDLTDLTIFYAFDILDDEARPWVEAAIATTPELVADLLKFRAATTAFAYSLQPVAPSRDLKNRLFQRIAADTQTQQVSPSVPVALQTQSQSETVAWEPEVIAGIKMRLLHQDFTQRENTWLIQCEAGAYYPAHRHGGTEEIFMLEGDLVADGQVYGRGAYLRSEPDSVHALWSRTGCLFFARASMDNEFVV